MQEEIEELRLEIVGIDDENHFNKTAIRFEEINLQFGELLAIMRDCYMNNQG